MTTPEPTAQPMRVGVVAGHRPCYKCGFALEGQPIEREPHYRLLVIFCPECGTPSPVTEYPVLGPWSKRIGAALLGLWCLILLAAFAASVAITAGFGAQILDQARSHKAGQIAKAHAAWYTSSGEPDRIIAAMAAVSNFNFSQFNQSVLSADFYSPVSDSWWAQQDPAQFGRDQWLRSMVTDPQVYLPLLAACIISALYGAFFALCTPGLRRARLLVVPIVSATLASGFVAVFALNSNGRSYANWLASVVPGYKNTAFNSACDVISVTFAFKVVAIALVAMCIGALIGRPCARFAARFLVAPGRLHLLEFLWSSDHLPFPKKSK